MKRIFAAIILSLFLFHFVFSTTLSDLERRGSISSFLASFFSRFFSSFFRPASVSSSITVSCPAQCVLGQTCQCTVTGCSSGSFVLYSQNCQHNNLAVQILFSNGQIQWTPSTAGTFKYKILCDDGLQTTCSQNSITVSAGGSSPNPPPQPPPTPNPPGPSTTLTWIKKFTTPSGVFLYDITFVSQSMGLAVGGPSWDNSGGGKIFRTTNGGNDWTEKDYEYGWISSVDCKTGSSGSVECLAAGRYGLILYSTDGGINWIRKTPIYSDGSIYSRWLYSTEWVPVTSYALVGGSDYNIFRGSPTSGDTFQDKNPSYLGVFKAIWDIDCPTSSICYAVGKHGPIFKSTDGGNTWTKIYGPGDEYFSQNKGDSNPAGHPSLYDVEFLDAQKGWVVGEKGTILITTNGGYSWDTKKISGDPVLYKVDMIDQNNGYISGENGKIFRTTDRWNSHETLDTPFSSDIRALYAFSMDKVWVATWNGEIWVGEKSS